MCLRLGEGKQKHNRFFREMEDVAGLKCRFLATNCIYTYLNDFSYFVVKTWRCARNFKFKITVF